MTWPQKLGFVHLQMSLLTFVWPCWQTPPLCAHGSGGPLSRHPGLLTGWPASTTRIPATMFSQGSSSEKPTFQKARGLPVVRGQWCWQCISFSSLEFPSSSRLEDICGQMSRKGWENLFFFFNWILGPQDEMCQEAAAWETIIQMGWRILGRGKKISWEDVTAVLGLI